MRESSADFGVVWHYTGQQRSTEVNKYATPNLEGVNKGQQRSTEVNRSQQQKSTEVNRGQQKSTVIIKNAFPYLEGVSFHNSQICGLLDFQIQEIEPCDKLQTVQNPSRLQNILK